MSFLSTPHDEFMFDAHTSRVDLHLDDRMNYKSLRRYRVVLKMVLIEYIILLHSICLGVKLQNDSPKLKLLW